MKIPPEESPLLPRTQTYKYQHKRGGRARSSLPDETWGIIEGMALCQSPITEIANTIKVHVTTLQRLIKDKYEVEDANEYIESIASSGKQSFRQRMYEMACDGKHPIVSIFAAKNWLGMKDERSRDLPDAPDTSKAQKLLEGISTVLAQISTSPTNLKALENKNRKIEIEESKQIQNAEFTEVTLKSHLPMP